MLYKTLISVILMLLTAQVSYSAVMVECKGEVVIGINKSVDASEWQGANYVINPDLSAFKDVERKYWKCYTNFAGKLDVREMTTQEKTDYDNAQAVKAQLESDLRTSVINKFKALGFTNAELKLIFQTILE